MISTHKAVRVAPPVSVPNSGLQGAGVKVALDTGYPPKIQEGLMEKLGLDKAVDAHVSSYSVAEGRPCVLRLSYTHICRPTR